jgi:multidrug efflux pump subunit AcrB
MEVPRGYEREWGGEYEEAARAQGNLGAQLPLGFLVMVLITVLLFGRVRQALVIWLIVPMSVCGVVLGLLATDIPFTFTALLGFLSLSGMLIKNSIVLVDEMDKRIEEGEAPYFAVRDGAVSRLRPVLLASGTTILGMTPILADAFFQSMAMTIIGGLTFATILTLIAAPVFYSLFFGIRPTTE